MYLCMYVNNVLKTSISLWCDIIWYETFIRSPWKEVLAFLTLWHLPQVTRRQRVHVTTPGWPVLKSQATKAASSEDARDPDAKGQGITNETKQAWFPDLLSIRTTISIGHKSQGSIWKYTSWNSFLSTHVEHSLAEICFFFFFFFSFFGHSIKETWSMRKRQRDTEKS